MARPLELKACKDPQTGKWRVNVIERLSPSGRRERRFFDTRTAALAYVEELKARRDNIAALPALSPAQLLDAAAALELLSEEHPDITLLHAVRGFIVSQRERGASVSVGKLFDPSGPLAPPKALPTSATSAGPVTGCGLSCP